MVTGGVPGNPACGRAEERERRAATWAKAPSGECDASIRGDPSLYWASITDAPQAKRSPESCLRSHNPGQDYGSDLDILPPGLGCPAPLCGHLLLDEGHIA